MALADRNRLMEQSRQALSEGQRFLTELSANGLTEARSAELNTAYTNAFAQSRNYKRMADDDLAMEQQGTEIRNYFEAPATTIYAPDGTPAASSHEIRTIDGRQWVPYSPTGAAHDVDQFVEFRGAEAELMRAIPMWPTESRAAYSSYLHHRSINSLSPVEMRALTPYIDPEGGYIVSRELRGELIRQERNLVQIRRYARVIRTNAASVSFPTFKFNMPLDKIRAGQRINTGDVKDILGKITFTPSEYAKIIRVPEQLVEDSMFPIVSYLAEEMALQSSEDEEGLFLTGSGKNEPYGVLTAPIISKQIVGAGISVSPDDIKGLPYELRVAFRRNGTWMFNRIGLQTISKFRDNIGGAGTGQYLWQQGMQAGQPDTLLGYPIMESEFFPNAFAGGAAAGTQIALFGDWRQYWIVDRLNLTLRTLDQLYAETSEVGYKWRKRFDAAPVRLEAFVELVRK